MLLPIKKNPINGFTVVRVHYSADSEKNTDEWIKSAMQGMTDRGWMREYEIDYSTYAGKAFYPEFKEHNIAKGPIEYKTGETLYRGWDFGFHRPCVVITKIDDYDRWCWMKCILGQDEGIMAFGQRVRRFCQAEYPGAKYIDACDPAGASLSDKGDQSSVQILNTLGIFPQFRKQNIKTGGEIIRKKLLIRVDGQPGLLVDPGETYLIDMMKGGLHYPEAKEGRGEVEYYEKDGYYDHGGDTVRYIATELFTVIGQQQENNELSQDENQRMYAMGQPMTNFDYNQQNMNDYGDMGDLI